MKDSAYAERKGHDDGGDPSRPADPPFLDHHKELRDTRDKEGHRDQTDEGLVGVEFSFFGQQANNSLTILAGV